MAARWWAAPVLAALASMALLLPAAAGAQEGENETGRQVYDQWCAGCHGVEGDGQGSSAAWMLPRPRDFTTALYQVRSTSSGSLPTDEDILRVIDQGMPGTTMPGWEGILTRREREAVRDYIKSFSRFFGQGDPPEAMEFARDPGGGEEALAVGREVYERVECYRCHGDAGRGDGASSPTLEDDMGLPIKARNLTQNWLFNGGGTVEDIYRRMRTGMDGTPMPSQSDLLAAEVVTEDELWQLAHYVRSLAPRSPPRAGEVVRAARVDEGEALPGLEDAAWEEADRYWIPLVGQIIVAPRWFDPRVTGVWVQALHDGQELALRVQWDDPSESPDPEWREWQERILASLEPTAGQNVDPGPHPDQLVVQFPAEHEEGRERPYFLMGDARRPAYLWRWRSDGPGATELVARGMGTEEARPGDAQSLSAESAFRDGRWTVLFRRALTDGEDLELVRSQAIPMTFMAWDGDHGEWDSRGAVGSWYFLYLQEETPVTVYVAPALALILTAGLGLLVVARAQKREREGEVETE